MCLGIAGWITISLVRYRDELFLINSAPKAFWIRAEGIQIFITIRNTRNFIILMTQNNELQNKDKNVALNYEPSKKIKRIDAPYISHEIRHLIHFEKGFFFTVRELLLRPGKSVREFLFEDRNKYVKPVIFLIFTSVIFTLITHYFSNDFSFFNIDRIEPLKGKIRAKEIGDWTNRHIGYTNLIMGVFIALWIQIFFKKHNYNIFEIVVLLCFALGEAILIFGIFIFIASLLKSSIIGLIGAFSYFGYIIWAIGQFFGEKKPINYIKSVLTYVLGNFTYLVTLILIAYFLKKF